MRSMTKNGVSTSEVTAMTKRAFDMQPLKIAEMKGGFFNAVYKVRLSFGEVILKVAPDDGVRVLRYEKNLMESEVLAISKILDFKYVPVPHVLFYDPSRDIINSEYLFMDMMPGVPFCDVCDNLPVMEQSELFAQIGIYARKINSIIGEYYGSLSVPEKRFDSWSRTFYQMIDDILCDAADMNVNLPIDYDHIRRRIESESELLDCVKRPSLLHKDLWIGNILVDTQNVEITGIIDCERAIFGDALMEPPCGMLDNDDFFGSYMPGLQLSRAQKLRMALYRIYLGLVCITECPFRRYEDDSVEQFARGYLDRGLSEYKEYKGEPF